MDSETTLREVGGFSVLAQMKMSIRGNVYGLTAFSLILSRLSR